MMIIATALATVNFVLPGGSIRRTVAMSGTPRPSIAMRLPTHEISDVDLQPRQQMDWMKQWYPVSPTRSLKRKKPNSVRLMEVPLVVWMSAAGWRVAQDRCPHRGAPLSYGRIETNNTLTCSYHGWQFDSSGVAGYVPTRGGGCGACLRTHPVRVCEHGLLWVWPKAAAAGSKEEAEAFAKPLPTEHLPHPSCTVTLGWMMHRVPIPWTSLVENSLDDAHGVHAHHGLAGLDRAIARPAEDVRTGESGAGDTFSTWTNVSGALLVSESTGATDPASVPRQWVNSYLFRAPHRSTVKFGPSFGFEAFIVPATHDETLLISAAFSTPAPGSGANLLRSAQVANPILAAVLHRLGAGVVCQDAALAESEGLDDLRGERWTGERTPGGMTTSDGAVLRVRKWLRRTGGPPLTPLQRDEVRRWEPRRHISVWEMHTRDCPTCRRAHDDAQFTSKVLLGVSTAAAAAGNLPAAISMLGVAELSRGTAHWFRNFDVRFDA